MTTITRENAEIKSFITGFLSDPAHDNQSSNSLLADVFRIALASLEAVSDERAAYELFMEKRFGESVDRRRAKNGDSEYMAWDMALGWIIWCHRATMLQSQDRGIKNGWISCSERMPAQDDWILIYSKHGEYMAGQVQGEYVELSDGTLSWLGNALLWMPLPETPQEADNG